MARYPSVLILCALCSAALSGEPLLRFADSSAQLEKFNSGDVVFDYPDNWRLMALPPPIVVGISRGDELSFTISRTGFDNPQTFNDVFAKYETDEFRKLYPDAIEFTSRAVTHKTLGEILQVDLLRPKGGQPGRTSRPLRLRLYSIPAGRTVYRVICQARADEFAKRHEPTFDRIMGTLVITPSAPGHVITP